MSPVPAAAVLASLAAVALIADRAWVVALLAAALLALCLKAPRGRRKLYLAGTLASTLSVFLLSPLVLAASPDAGPPQKQVDEPAGDPRLHGCRLP